jgi:hypothetical protein
MTEHFILELAETRVHYSDPEFWEPDEYRSDTTEYQVSTRKLEEWVKDHEFEYGYIQNIIEACMKGAWHHASRKYSFGDTPDWWGDLKPDANCTDPVKCLAYEVVVS